jgi:curved DNA-binding protein CbpA
LNATRNLLILYIALAYHPDRNPGRESEVTAKFQKIQSAHEVLTDAVERAKYDSNRPRATSGFRNSTAYTGASSSSGRGNPWANAGSQWAPPPKRAPTARKGPPPPSAGAQRYQKFDAGKGTYSWAHNEGPEARTKTYEAWENMRGHGHSSTNSDSTPKTDSARSQRGPPPKVPPRESPQYTKYTNSSQNYGPSAQARAGYSDFRQGEMHGSSPRRSDSMNGRKGFMPNTPGGDEPAAPKGAYFTTQRAAPEPPPVPPRNPSPIPPTSSAKTAVPDPLNQFREAVTKDQPRTSTPYSTHGGEKFNPFESANVGRSKSTRQPEQRAYVSRPGSDPNLGSPHQTPTSTNRQARNSKQSPVQISSDSDSDSSLDRGPVLNARPFGRRRVSKNNRNGVRPAAQTQQMPQAAESSAQPRKPLNKLERFRRWMEENPGLEPPLNGFPPDGPPLREDVPQTAKPDEAKMYDPFHQFPASPSKKSNSCDATSFSNLQKSSESASRPPYFKTTDLQHKYPNLFPGSAEAMRAPSGASVDAQALNAFEGIQRNVIDHLLTRKQTSSTSAPRTVPPEKRDLPREIGLHAPESKVATRFLPRSTVSMNKTMPRIAKYESGVSSDKEPTASDAGANSSQHRRISVDMSPSKKIRPSNQLHSTLDGLKKTRMFSRDHHEPMSNANQFEPFNRFSFNVNNDTFKQTQPKANGFTSASAETISTRFTPEDWEGKFEAGADYFKPEQRSGANAGSPRRAQSGSRPRGRSPAKVPPINPKLAQQRNADADNFMESPGGTRFSPEEWAQHFRPQTFAPPAYPVRTPGRKTRGSFARPTMGTAAVVDDSETPDEKPLFGDGPADSTAPASFSPALDAMDVDSPPTKHTVPKFVEKPNGNTKRPAPVSQPRSPVDEESLKVDFDDLNLQDLIKTLQLPAPPERPENPPPATMTEIISTAAKEKYFEQFATYMKNWDLFNNKIMLHLVARKNQVDAFGSQRWEDDQCMESYRRGLREDGLVMKHWMFCMEIHEKALKDCAVVRERAKTRDEMEKILNGESFETPFNGTGRPRKKTH